MVAITTVSLPIIDLSSPDRLSTVKSLRQACIEYGCFNIVNHGVDEDFMKQVFEHSAKFFSLPIQDKLNFSRKEYRGYTPLFAETHPSSLHKGDSKESFYIGPLTDITSVRQNQWPSDELLPNWKPLMESLFWKILSAGRRLLSLIALSLNLDEAYFEKSPLNPEAFLRLLHYPGELGPNNEEIYGSAPHSDYGMITLLINNGVPGLQICKDKSKQPQVWEDVAHVKGAFVVNIGDMMERWTNCLYRPTLHRVMPTGKERYSVAFFMDPPSDCVVECLESCQSESNPPRYPPISSWDYLNEKFRFVYGSEKELK